MKGGDIMEISAEEFKKYIYDPSWYVETWTGCALGPGCWLDIGETVYCDIDEEARTIIVY